MNKQQTKKETYHHGRLREELIRRGLDALEREGVEALSLRALAEAAGVSKTAPYRHFKNKDLFLGALADEGYRLLYEALAVSLETQKDKTVDESPLSLMGRTYMEFAVARPALYRLMNSSLICVMPNEYTGWARKSLQLLAQTLAAGNGAAPHTPDAGETESIDLDITTAAWAYIHGLTMIRIDKLYPTDLPEPDWDRLMKIMLKIPIS
ncbi:TetR/AcrR family transcriptional regulator [Gracilinema caldarium]|uniref:TetR/AcrR family transcriptional regulator n=1 Tax=Gracilinema caldarium TaxID=215591 RepID=UPI0026F182B8|nr:TetR/AcrR family transcriptional regulator [Gracilinema caldarium]